MNRLVTIAAAAAISFAAISTPAQAGNNGGAVAAGVIGGLAAGALIGGAVANSQPRYYAPPPAPVYVEPGPAYVVEEPSCRLVRQRFWDGYGYRMRRVEVCD